MSTMTVTWNPNPKDEGNVRCQAARPMQTGIFGLRYQENYPTPTSNTFSILADDDDKHEVVRELAGWAYKSSIRNPYTSIQI